MLRKKGVVGKFVEFFGAGLAALSLADRATIANMAPEYGATCGIFPIDDETLRYLRFTGRSADDRSSWSRPTRKEQGLFHDRDDAPRPVYSDTLRAGPGERRAERRRPEAPAGSRQPVPDARSRSTTRCRS